MHQVFEQARFNMVESQIRPNKVTDERLLEALRYVPREKFVPRHLKGIAYVDQDIAIGKGRYLPEPMVIARLIQAAGVEPDDVVLDVGCSLGYSSAVLGFLAGTVVGVECDRMMAKQADKALGALDIVNVVIVHQESLTEGYTQQEPYDVIVVNGSVSSIPENIAHQLREGGRMVTVLSQAGEMGRAVLITRTKTGFDTRVLFDAAMPTLSGFEAKKEFVF